MVQLQRTWGIEWIANQSIAQLHLYLNILDSHWSKPFVCCPVIGQGASELIWLFMKKSYLW